MYFRQLSIQLHVCCLTQPLPEVFESREACASLEGNVARVTCTQSHRLSVCSKSFLCSWSAFKTSEHRKKSFPEGEPNASWSETYAALLQQCRSSESICPTCNSEQWGLTQHGHTFGQHANAWRKVPCLILTYFNLNFGETLI